MKHQILFGSSLCLCLLLLSGVVFAQEPTPDRFVDGATKDWQLDFKKFVGALRDCADANCPVANFKGAQVRWEGAFTSWNSKAGVARMDMDFGDATLNIGGIVHKILCCNLRILEPAQWETLAPGSKVKFQATLNTLVPVLIAKGQALIVLDNPIMVGSASSTEEQNERRRNNADEVQTEGPKTAGSTAVAEQMVAAVKLASAGVSAGMNPLMALALPDVNSPAQTAFRKNVKDAAREITGESFTGQQGLNLDLALIQWMTGRVSLEIYGLRAQRLGKPLLQDWQAAQTALDARQVQLTLVLLGIIFQDQLWEGADWKTGNPQRALARLKGLPSDVVKKWAAASKTAEFPFAAANSLVSVDSLFSGDVFQLQRFEEALPLAKKRIEDSSPKM